MYIYIYIYICIEYIMYAYYHLNMYGISFIGGISITKSGCNSFNVFQQFTEPSGEFNVN